MARTLSAGASKRWLDDERKAAVAARGGLRGAGPKENSFPSSSAQNIALVRAHLTWMGVLVDPGPLVRAVPSAEVGGDQWSSQLTISIRASRAKPSSSHDRPSTTPSLPGGPDTECMMP